MANNNYEIWAIQNNSLDIYDAIDGLENSKDNTLFTNCKSYLRVGDRKLYVQFDTAFISEDLNRLIVLWTKGKVRPKAFERLLAEENIQYNKVQFMETMPLTEEEIKEVWFVNDVDTLQGALLESKNLGNDICEFYPDLKGRFEIRYPLTEEKFAPLLGQNIRGAMTLEDKIILLMNTQDEKNVTYSDALRALYTIDIAPLVVVGETFLPNEAVKQYKKEQ